MLRKSPGFALTGITVLALGIGANAAVFSVVDAVLLRSLPLRDPERVVMLWEKNPALGGSMEQILDEDTSQRRFQSFVMSVFAGLALVLASIGLFGVLTSLVGQRTQEIGIRMALGAQSKDVLRMVLGEGFRMVLLGVVIGVGAGIDLSWYLASLFFGVSPGNPATYLQVALVMIIIALVACLLPAWRAIRVRPMEALRYE